ncbi:hypothetical protein [Undibacterium curvum]|uniref:Uncharacterized protein n=1 Tax=Undibacterium curvum TaxID=2762294 RepID=A0ABR7A896_9BURK|nr:hypothetical protein [Undibacterium curvum]MBC3933109.1 hypothetical protein [Undibacterium curvum]
MSASRSLATLLVLLTVLASTACERKPAAASASKSATAATVLPGRFQLEDLYGQNYPQQQPVLSQSILIRDSQPALMQALAAVIFRHTAISPFDVTQFRQVKLQIEGTQNDIQKESWKEVANTPHTYEIQVTLGPQIRPEQFVALLNELDALRSTMKPDGEFQYSLRFPPRQALGASR